MSWQVDYALKYINDKNTRMSGEVVRGNLIKITSDNQSDVHAVILGDYEITENVASTNFQEYGPFDFLCGYRSECVWHGDAIQFAANYGFGWGNSGTLMSGVRDGDASTAGHKTYRFSHRLIAQYSSAITSFEREYDRIYTLHLRSGGTLRLGMIKEYEPTADAVRSAWEKFGAVDVMWNINPNGNPTKSAKQAASELGSRIVKWEELKSILRGK